MQIPCIVPRLLYGVYAEIACTRSVVLSVLFLISMYQDLSFAAITGAPDLENTVAII